MSPSQPAAGLGCRADGVSCRQGPAQLGWPALSVVGLLLFSLRAVQENPYSYLIKPYIQKLFLTQTILKISDSSIMDLNWSSQ